MDKAKFLEKVPQEYSNEEFYNLCKAFMDVVLNADKFKTPDGAVVGNFHLEDMNNASRLAKDYLVKHGTNVNVLKRTIRIYAHKSIDNSDKRQKAFYDQNSNHGNMPAYQAGTLYLFTEITNNVMDKIFKSALA